MAYDQNNLAKWNPAPFANMWSCWIYKSADNFTTVKASGYISNAYAMGVRKGDLIVVFENATVPVVTIAMILTSTEAPACTMSQTGLVP